MKDQCQTGKLHTIFGSTILWCYFEFYIPVFTFNLCVCLCLCVKERVGEEGKSQKQTQRETEREFIVLPFEGLKIFKCQAVSS